MNKSYCFGGVLTPETQISRVQKKSPLALAVLSLTSQRWPARLRMTGNPPERLQLTIPIIQRSRRHLTNYLYLIVVLPGFPVSLTAMKNRCVNCKLSHGDARKNGLQTLYPNGGYKGDTYRNDWLTTWLMRGLEKVQRNNSAVSQNKGATCELVSHGTSVLLLPNC